MEPEGRIGPRLLKDRQENSRTHRILKIVVGILVAIVIFILIGAGLFCYYASSAPKVTRYALASDNSTKIYDSHNHLISKLGAQNREYASNRQIPNQLRHAVVSIEDRHFYKDHGVDPVRIVKALFADLTGSSQLGLQGGSTLTQQLVKLSVFSTKASDQTIRRKAQEAWLAINVDRRYPKRKILEYYINKVYMGHNTYGMRTAAKYYYDRPLNKLTLPETAMLAGMPQSPTLYDPYTYPKNAKQRRNQVLSAMEHNHKITPSQEASAKATPIKAGLATSHASADTNARHERMIDGYLKQVLIEMGAKGFKTRRGLKIYTNLNFANQKKLYELANNNREVKFPSSKFQIGASMVDNQNGKINAMIGGRKTKIPFGLDRALQTNRSNGSTMKPMMDYGPAIQYLKYPTYKVVHDTPFTYPGTTIPLKDYDNRYEGAITMRRALIESRNIPAIRTLQKVGIPRATKFLSKLGMNFKQKLQLQNGISGYVSPLQEAAAYAAFSNGGVYHRPYTIRKIVEANGNTHRYHPKGNRAMSRSTAFMITNMLKGVLTDPKGSGRAARIPGLNEAGKTGTTQYPSTYKGNLPGYAAMDSWFTGYTHNYSMSIWTGYDSPMQSGHYVSGPEVNIAQEYYKYAMKYAQRNRPDPDWVKPSSVGEVNRNGRPEYYVLGHHDKVDTATNNSGRARKIGTTDVHKGDKNNNRQTSVDNHIEAQNHSNTGNSGNHEDSLRNKIKAILSRHASGSGDHGSSNQ